MTSEGEQRTGARRPPSPIDAGRLDPPGSVEEALTRAQAHTRAALGEALAAARALLDAACLAASGESADAHRGLAALGQGLDDLSARLSSRGGRVVPERLLGAILDALDAEIARWEERSRDDSDARAVLRAFLGLREILWEFGLRRDGDEPPSPASDPRPVRSRKAGRRRAARRVQRVRVQG